MSIIVPANTLAAGGFSVDNSCRFNIGSSDHLTRSLGGSPTSTRKATWSYWVKRSTLTSSASEMIYSNEVADDNNRGFIQFEDNDSFRMTDSVSSTQLKTNRLFRDVASFYHIVLAIDTTQGTAANRIKLYVNGVQETSFATASYPDQNDDLKILTGGQTNKQHISKVHGGSGYFGGYLSEFVFIDGLQLAPTSFGEFDEDSGIWKPIDVSGLTFGTNGFYLDFKASGNLGNDANGGTDLTEVNLAATDQSTDTCTNNFATINSLDNFYAQATFSEGNLRVVTQVAAFAPIRSTIGVSSGKWYAEVKIITASATDHEQGVVSQAAVNNSAGVGRIAEGYGYAGNGQVFRNDSQVTYSANSLAADDILGIYLDLDNNKLYFAKNGTIQNSGAGISMVDPASTTDGVYYFATSDNANLSGGSYRFDWNFGNPIFTGTDKSDANGYGSFEYDPSAGTFDSASKDFYALNTKNLAEFG